MFKFWDKKKNGNKLIKNFNDFLMFAERVDYQPNLENFLMTAYKNPFIAGALDRLEKGMQNIDWNTYKKGNKDNLNLGFNPYSNGSSFFIIVSFSASESTK